jgi:hypothetical protein
VWRRGAAPQLDGGPPRKSCASPDARVHRPASRHSTPHPSPHMRGTDVHPIQPVCLRIDQPHCPWVGAPPCKIALISRPNRPRRQRRERCAAALPAHLAAALPARRTTRAPQQRFAHTIGRCRMCWRCVFRRGCPRSTASLANPRRLAPHPAASLAPGRHPAARAPIVPAPIDAAPHLPHRPPARWVPARPRARAPAARRPQPVSTGAAPARARRPPPPATGATTGRRRTSRRR